MEATANNGLTAVEPLMRQSQQKSSAFLGC